jgi:hypothetical protein
MTPPSSTRRTAAVQRVPDLRPPDDDPGHEGRDEAVAFHQLDHAVGEQHSGEREDAGTGFGKGVPARDHEQDAPEEPADGGAQQRSYRDAVAHVPDDPCGQGAGIEATSSDMERQIDEREGEPVVQPRLGGQAEADRVLPAFKRRPDLDVAGQHGIGRRQHAEQQRAGQRQSRERPSQKRHRRDGQRHRHGKQADGGAPEPPATQVVDPEAGREQNHDDDDLGGDLPDSGIGRRVKPCEDLREQNRPEHSEADQQCRRGGRAPEGQARKPVGK